MSEFNTGQPEFIHQSEVLQLAERAQLDPSLLEGTRYESLKKGEAITFDIRELQPIDDEGLMGIIGVGNTAVRMYGLGEGREKSLYLTPGIPQVHNEGKLQSVNLVPIDAGTSRWFGREAPYKTRLGLLDDSKISRHHFYIQRSSGGQLLIQDNSLNGTELLIKEAPRQKLDRLVDIPLEKHFGRVVVKDQLDRPQ